MSAKEKRIFRVQQAGLLFAFLLVAALAAAPVALSASASADTVSNQQTTTAAYTTTGSSTQYAGSAAASQMYGMQTAPKKAVVAEDSGTIAFQLVMAIAVAGLVLHFAFKTDDMPSDRS